MSFFNLVKTSVALLFCRLEGAVRLQPGSYNQLHKVETFEINQGTRTPEIFAFILHHLSTMGVVGQEIIRRIISDQGHQSLHRIVTNLQGSKSDGEKKVAVGADGEKKWLLRSQQPLFSPQQPLFSPIKLKLVSTLSRK